MGWPDAPATAIVMVSAWAVVMVCADEVTDTVGMRRVTVTGVDAVPEV